MFPGGNTLNVSVFAARFGASSAYLGQIAADAAGDAISTALQDEGVDTSGLRRAPGSTAHCVIGHDARGDRVFVSSDLGVSVFTPSSVDLARLKAFDAIHVGATSQLDPWIPAFAAETRLSYDFGTRHNAEHIHRVGRSCYLIVLSGGGLDDAAFESLLEQAEGSGATWTLVTRGTEGATLSNGGRRRWKSQAHRAEGVIDTLGAGDTFCARVLVGLLRNENPSQFLPEAAAVAAQTCTHFGAFGHGVPMAAQIVATTTH
ncbi:ribokinase [Arthrobacter sp. AFG20]|nr:ribokinase [Arthrobacter sp. AFG20]